MFWLLIFIFFNSTQATYSCWDCRHFAAWSVNYTNAHEKSIMIQDWLYAFQHSHARCLNPPNTAYDRIKGGLACSYVLNGLRMFTFSLETGKIFRPTPDFLWASPNQTHCTLNIRSLDCYNRELSNCNRPHMDYASNEPNNLSDFNTTLGKLMNSSWNADMCLLGKTLEMPTIWVMGQIVEYMFRPRPDVAASIQRRVDQVYHGVDIKTQSVIAVHYRAGHPDTNRQLISLDHYMTSVAIKAKELEQDGRPVAVVYLTSQDNDNIFHNVSYMQKTYGGNYTYKLLDMVRINGSEEVEYLVHDNLAPAELLVPEFMTDIQLMANADCFIGSKSSIYVMSALLRYARAPTRHKKYTCHVSQSSELICEDNPKAIDIWRLYYYSNSFRGGTAF